MHYAQRIILSSAPRAPPDVPLAGDAAGHWPAAAALHRRRPGQDPDGPLVAGSGPWGHTGMTGTVTQNRMCSCIALHRATEPVLSQESQPLEAHDQAGSCLSLDILAHRVMVLHFLRFRS